MHLIAAVCCIIGCLALTGFAKIDTETEETSQIALTLNEKHVEDNELEETSPKNHIGWDPRTVEQVNRAQIAQKAEHFASYPGWISSQGKQDSPQVYRGRTSSRACRQNRRPYQICLSRVSSSHPTENQNSNSPQVPSIRKDTKETGQLDETKNTFGGSEPFDMNPIDVNQPLISSHVQKRQTPLYPLPNLGWYPDTSIQIQPTNSTQRLQYFGVAPQYQKFVNETLSRVPSGICQKEVPTASLYGNGDNVPRGNGSNPSLSRVQACCRGYQRNEHIFRKCDPICESGCVNGVCAGPNECVCYPDHVKDLAGFCLPSCPNGCGNGDCNGNVCVCKNGYTLDKSNKFCIPRCNPGCGKGNCTAPNTCSCNNGYEANAQGVCVPKCPNGCELGECVAPGECACRPGFKLHGSKCAPFCERGCVNGECVAPNTCSCTDGYAMDPTGTICEPRCDHPCLNGRCDGPNRCKCNSGYQVDDYDSFKCNAHCPTGCVNGVCSSPGLCLCNAGFVKDRSKKGSQACIPRA